MLWLLRQQCQSLRQRTGAAFQVAWLRGALRAFLCLAGVVLVLGAGRRAGARSGRIAWEIVQGDGAPLCSQDRAEVCRSHEEKERSQQRVCQEEVHSGAATVSAHLRCAAGTSDYHQVIPSRAWDSHC